MWEEGGIFVIINFNYSLYNAMMIKRKCTENIKWSEELKYAADYQYIIKLAQEYNFKYLEKPLYIYRRHENNLSNNHQITVEEEKKIVKQLGTDKTGLTTKSNLITINFESIKINIYEDAIEKIVPAVDGESIKLSASFITLDTDVSYDITVKNDIGENLIFDELMSSISIDGQKLEFVDFHEDNNIVSIKISNSQEIRNKNIRIIIATKIRNSQQINDVLINKFTLSINDIECSSDTIKIPLIKPIFNLTNDIITEK